MCAGSVVVHMVWLCGYVAVWLCGMHVWLCGCVVVCTYVGLCGCVVAIFVWLCGCGDAYVGLCGCVAVWLCGCVTVSAGSSLLAREGSYSLGRRVASELDPTGPAAGVVSLSVALSTAVCSILPPLSTVLSSY